ncbi:MAG: YeeE/YedE family protein [Candidatus Omnitrophica bacterium]|nr:YeeE/YedE family protein [Candidatus Omnitrophota bacterium]
MKLENSNKKMLQLLMGFLFGICFGFLLQKGGVTRYDVMIGQLLLEDFRVIKIMLSAILVGMWGIYFLKKAALVELHIKPGAIGSSLIGGLVFGVGMGILGYCPGTVSGAAAQGNLDALFGGIAGLLAGSWIFSRIFPSLNGKILHIGDFGKKNLPEILHIPEWAAMSAVTVVIIGFVILLETNNIPGLLGK